MRFKEKEDLGFSVKGLRQCFVYFLIEDGEVVYVGQTKRGLPRVGEHFGAKDFDEVKIIYCDPKDLDAMEVSYIREYRPKYNKNLIAINNYRNIHFVRNYIREKCDPTATTPQVKKWLESIGIEVARMQGVVGGRINFYITIKDFERVKNILEKRG